MEIVVEKPGSSGDFDRLVSSISSNLQKLIQHTTRYKNLNSKIGTAQDDDNLIVQLRGLNHSTNDLITSTNTQLKNLTECLEHLPEKLKTQRKLQHEKLVKDFQNVLIEVKKQQQQAADKERSCVKQQQVTKKSTDPFSEDYDYGGETSSLVYGVRAPQEQISLQAVRQAEGELVQIQEREQAIKNLESDIVMINDIYKDLAKLVQEQGETVDNIEAHIESAKDNVVKAGGELEQAEHHQTSARRKKLICFAIIFAVVLVLLLVIILPIALKYGKKED